jgi:hypothetical protein
MEDSDIDDRVDNADAANGQYEGEEDNDADICVDDNEQMNDGICGHGQSTSDFQQGDYTMEDVTSCQNMLSESRDDESEAEDEMGEDEEEDIYAKYHMTQSKLSEGLF